MDVRVSAVAEAVGKRLGVCHILLLVYVAWMSFGVFPLVCYEGDSLHLIMGCSMMAAGAWEIPPLYSYAYDMQPLVTWTIVVLKKLVPVLACEQIYCLLSACASVIMMLGGMRLICRLSGVSRSLAFFAMFLFPETYACGMYANSAVIAGAMMVWGCCFFLSGKCVWASLLFCVAPLFRIDVLTVYPSVLLLFLLSGDTWRRAWLKSCALAVLVVSVVGLGCWVLGANPLEQTIGWYDEMNQTQQYAGDVPLAVYSFYTVVNIVLVPVGAWRLFRQHRFLQLSFILLPMVLLHIVQRNSGCASKHYLYLLPFAAMCSSVALDFLWRCFRRRALAGWIAVAAVALFMVVSVRFPFRNTPALNVNGSVGTVGPCSVLFTETITPFRVSFGIGAGRLLPTADEQMLLTGNAFYPFFIRELKTMYADSRDAVCDYFERHKAPANIVTGGWESAAFYPLPWVDSGYKFELLNPDPMALRIFRSGSSEGVGELTFVCFHPYMEDGSWKRLFASVRDPHADTYLIPDFVSSCYLDKSADSGRTVKLADRFYKAVPQRIAGRLR